MVLCKYHSLAKHLGIPADMTGCICSLVQILRSNLLQFGIEFVRNLDTFHDLNQFKKNRHYSTFWFARIFSKKKKTKRTMWWARSIAIIWSITDLTLRAWMIDMMGIVVSAVRFEIFWIEWVLWTGSIMAVWICTILVSSACWWRWCICSWLSFFTQIPWTINTKNLIKFNNLFIFWILLQSKKLPAEPMHFI